MIEWARSKILVLQADIQYAYMNRTVISGKSAILGVSILLFLYICFRASMLSFTHDEGFTYSKYVHYSYSEILQYKTDNIAPNNQVLNTFSQKFFSGMFGTSEFVLRLGSILSFALFLITLYTFARHFFQSFALPGFLVVVLHPYVLDFMVLSRGYGMALTGMLLSILGVVSGISNQFKTKYYLIALASGILAVLANYSLLNFFLINSVLFLAFQIFLGLNRGHITSHRLIITNIFSFVGSLILLGSLIYAPLKLILERHLLMGGESGFWADTVGSLCHNLAYGMRYQHIWEIILKALVITIPLLATLRVSTILKKESRNSTDTILVFLYLLNAGLVSATLIQHYILGSVFPMDRMAISFVLAFLLLVVITLVSHCQENNRLASLFRISLYSITCLFALHMLMCSNLSYSLEWKYDANTKEIAKDIEHLEGEVQLGVHPLYVHGLNFYRQTKHLTKFPDIHSDGYRLKGDYNYFVIASVDRHKIEAEGLTILKEYSPGGAILAKK